MYRGRFQQGQEVPLVLLVQLAGVPQTPDACPLLDVYDATSKHVSGQRLPIIDPVATTGLFAGYVFLDENFLAGSYSVVYRWQVASVNYSSVDSFEVLTGGSGSGQVISMYDYERPQGICLLQQRSSGRIYKGKNPRL